ncbi:MAG TPA: hypothetical protein VNI84_13605 [Pyrinomonadaceae bacterium]|nr:hypothetical protein [Pyrinomonadaceae bacterium]
MKFNQIKNAPAQVSRFRKMVFNDSLMAIALLMPVLLVSSCSDSASEKVEKVGGVTARQVIENPTAYVGKTVTVSGDVEEIWNPRAFNMDSGLTVGELLVVGREPFPNVPDKGANTAYLVSDVATVTGVVRMLVTADVEREIGWDLDPRIEAEFNAKPVLIAQSIAFKPGANRAAIPANANGGQAANNDEITDYLIIVTTPDRSSLVGRRVRLTDVKVQSVVGDRTFYVGPSESQRVLVVLDEVKTPNSPTEGRYDINAGQTISFTGVIEKVPSVEEARQRFGKLMNEAELNKLKDQQILIHTDALNIKGK